MNLKCPWEWGVEFLNKLFGGGLIEKVKSEQRIEGGKGICSMAIRRKGTPCGGNSLCKDPEVAVCLPHSRDSKEANMAGVEGTGNRVRDEVGR